MNKKGNGLICFLDAGSLDYGDVSFKGISSLGKFKAYAYTPPSKIISRSKNVKHLITNKCLLTKDVLKKLKGVECIHIAATGVNNIDLTAAKELGIGVTNAVGYSTETVVQFTFSYVLGLSGSLIQNNKAVHSKKWSESKHFTLGTHPNHEVAGKTLGIIGYGTIGKRVAEVAKAFQMKTLVAKIPGRGYSARQGKGRVPLSQLLKKADFVSIHAPLTPLTKNLIDAPQIRMMKPSAYLLNVARGGIVNESALRDALVRKKIAGAASDVLSVEPPPKNHRLLGTPNLILTPHVAWGSLESRIRLIREIMLNIQAFKRGRKRNRVV